MRRPVGCGVEIRSVSRQCTRGDGCCNRVRLQLVCRGRGESWDARVRCARVGLEEHMRTQRPGTASAPRLLAGVGLVLGLLVIATLASPPSTGLGQSPGLVAAYSFDEGAGASVADASGSGNVGAIGSTTWTSLGRFGNALAFNGQARGHGARRTLAASAGGNDALPAWVFPTASRAAGAMSSTRGTTTTTLSAPPRRTRRPSGRRIDLRGNWAARCYGPGTAAREHVDAPGRDLRRGDARLYVNGAQVAPRADRDGSRFRQPAGDRR